MDELYGIDDMPNLRRQLGKAGTDRVRYCGEESQESFPKRGRPSKCVENTVLMEMQGRKPSDPFCGVSDIIAGVARLDHHNQKDRNIPLNMNRMYAILQLMDNITCKGVMSMMDVGEHQARKYVRACAIAIPFLEEHFEEYGDEVVADALDQFVEQ